MFNTQYIFAGIKKIDIHDRMVGHHACHTHRKYVTSQNIPGSKTLSWTNGMVYVILFKPLGRINGIIFRSSA